MNRIEFSTIEFRIAHGKEPRGRGSWAFALTRNPQPEEIVWHNGTYAEAKSFARAYYLGKMRGDECATVYVQS
jgi:hypothetical protein